MSQRVERGRSSPEESQRNQEGIKIKFSNPEVLRAFILDPKISRRPATLAERMSGIREVSLGEIPLDGVLFDSVKLTLVVEPDRVPRTEVGRPTAIIRADIALGEKDSNLKKL